MLLDKLKNYSIVLASQSPRRSELLSGLGIVFEVDWKKTNETLLMSNFTQPQLVEYLAWQKAQAVANKYNLTKTFVIGGDTIVCLNDEIIGKPKDRSEAIDTLRLLSAKQHHVVSGVCILHRGFVMCNHDVAEVYFKQLSDEEIMYYVDTYHPFDKAGSYGIQEWIGYQSIERINGSFYSVMGLPTHLLWNMLEEIMSNKKDDEN